MKTKNTSIIEKLGMKKILFTTLSKIDLYDDPKSHEPVVVHVDRQTGVISISNFLRISRNGMKLFGCNHQRKRLQLKIINICLSCKLSS